MHDVLNNDPNLIFGFIAGAENIFDSNQDTAPVWVLPLWERMGVISQRESIEFFELRGKFIDQRFFRIAGGHHRPRCRRDRTERFQAHLRLDRIARGIALAFR